MILIRSVFLFTLFIVTIHCTAWPALVPIPPGKSKTTIYPIPLPGSSTPAVTVTITDSSGTALPTANPIKTIAFNGSITLKAFNGTTELTGVAWSVTDTAGAATTLASIGASTGVFTASNTPGTVTVKATVGANSGVVNMGIAAVGNSILGFDGKNFISIGETSNTTKSEGPGL